MGNEREVTFPPRKQGKHPTNLTLYTKPKKGKEAYSGKGGTDGRATENNH